MSSILLGDIENGDYDVIIIDTSLDRRKVVITGPGTWEEGSPERALVMASNLRSKCGHNADVIASAIEDAARQCIEQRKLH